MKQPHTPGCTFFIVGTEVVMPRCRRHRCRAYCRNHRCTRPSPSLSPSPFETAALAGIGLIRSVGHPSLQSRTVFVSVLIGCRPQTPGSILSGSSTHPSMQFVPSSSVSAKDAIVTAPDTTQSWNTWCCYSGHYRKHRTRCASPLHTPAQSRYWLDSSPPRLRWLGRCTSLVVSVSSDTTAARIFRGLTITSSCSQPRIAITRARAVALINRQHPPVSLSLARYRHCCNRATARQQPPAYWWLVRHGDCCSRGSRRDSSHRHHWWLGRCTRRRSHGLSSAVIIGIDIGIAATSIRAIAIRSKQQPRHIRLAIAHAQTIAQSFWLQQPPSSSVASPPHTP